jgi:hypothetical protein
VEDGGIVFEGRPDELSSSPVGAIDNVEDADAELEHEENAAVTVMAAR